MNNPGATSPSRQIALGVLPSELLLEVLDMLAEDASTDVRDKRRERKRVISSVSLVCASWARHIRPLLFTNIVLRSREDVAFFSTMLRSSSSRKIAQAVLHLEVQEGPKFLLGLRLAGRTFKYRLPSLLSIRCGLALDNCHAELESSVSPLPVIDATIPLELRRDGFGTVTRLELFYYRFTNFNAFARLVHGFASLEELNCVGISWPSGGQRDRVQRCPSRQKLRLITSTCCSDRWSLLYLLSVRTSDSFAELSSSRTQCLDTTELPPLIALTRLVLDSEDDPKTAVACIECGPGRCIVS